MREEKILINGLEINYRIIGEGKPLLILHGWGSRSEKWERVGELLIKKGFKVIILDLPGFGKSQKLLVSWNLDEYCNFVEKFINFLGLDKFYLLGHSFGGGLSTKYSIKFPHKIEKLFLVASACIRRKTFKKNLLAKSSKVLKIFSFLPFYSLFRKAFYKFIVRKSDYLYTEGIMKETYLKIISEDLSNILSFISVQTIIIWGDNDDVTPLADGKFINQQIKNSKMIIIPGGDHDLEQKMPEILAEKILENLPC